MKVGDCVLFCEKAKNLKLKPLRSISRMNFEGLFWDLSEFKMVLSGVDVKVPV